VKLVDFFQDKQAWDLPLVGIPPVQWPELEVTVQNPV